MKELKKYEFKTAILSHYKDDFAKKMNDACFRYQIHVFDIKPDIEIDKLEINYEVSYDTKSTK